MENFYYSFVCAIALIVHMIVNRQYFLEDDNRKEVKRYRYFLMSVMAYYIIDLLWGVLYEWGHVSWMYANTIAYYIVMVLTVVFCCRYIVAFLKIENTLSRVLNTFAITFALMEIVILIVNHFDHIFFWFYEDGSYQAMPWRHIALIIQILFFGGITVMSFVVAKKTNSKARNRNKTMFFFCLCMTLALTLQGLFPLLPLYTVGLSVGTLIIYGFIRIEERNVQMKQIEHLNNQLMQEQAVLRKQKDDLSAAMGVINGLTNDYHTIWVVDKENFKLELIRMPGGNVIKESVKLAFAYDDCNVAMQKYVEMYVCEEDQERVLQQVNTKVIMEQLSKSDFYAVNYKRRKPNGEIDYNQVAFANADTEDGKRQFVFGFRDITDIVRPIEQLREERKLREEINAAKIAAEAANEAKTKFLQNMSHEIRTPLNAMFGFAQLLGLPDGSVTEEEKSQYNKYIYNSYKMLEMLVSDIIDIADSEHGNYRIDIADVSINSVCNNAIMSIEYRVPSNVKLYMTSDFDDDFTVKSDERRIQQVLINYLTNACKHTQQGEIHLHASKTEHPGKITLSVTDTGSGIPAEKADEIFKRFTKLNQFVQGSGLGLSICQIIANKLNGEVYLDTSYTNGARFVFVI